MEFHEAANIFPLDEEHIDELAEDIAQNGQQVLIEVLDGKIIDGRRRWLACEKADVNPKTRVVQAADPIAYVISLNLKRRQLSPTQAAMVGARAAALRKKFESEAKERQKRKPRDFVPENFPEQKGEARDKIGEMVGVSGKTIDHATRVLNSENQTLIDAVDDDILSVSGAVRISCLPEEEIEADIKGKRERRANGQKRKPRPTEKREEDSEEGQKRGVGVIRAHEAVDILVRIPKNDALRKRGFQYVTDWIKKNK